MAKRVHLPAALLSVAVLLVLTLWVTASGKPPAPPPSSPGTGKIVFTRGSWGDAQLVVHNLDTGGESVLLSSAANPHFRYFERCSWSHTGDVRWIIIDADVPYPPDPTTWMGETWAVKEDGTGLHLVLPNLLDTAYPALVGDDKYLAFVVYEGDVSSIYVQPFDAVLGQVSGTASKITQDTLWGIYHITWSPDGLSIAFVGIETDRTSVRDIWRMDFDLEAGLWSAPFNLTNTPDVGEWNPDWSEATPSYPLGRIAFDRPVHFSYLAHMNPDGTDVRILGRKGLSQPSWAPDASKIAIRGIATINPDGSQLVNVTNGTWPAWRP